MLIGYCGNVHPGRTIDEVKANLITHSLKVKERFSPEDAMGIGLWLSASAARELDDHKALVSFRDWLEEHGLLPYTLNGFPFGDFHQAVVKHDVYRPTWADPERLDYTVRLAEILNLLLPESLDGSISTLPLGWPVDGTKSHVDDELFWKSCANNLTACAERLDELAQDSGRNIMLCIEPEPGCILDTAGDIVAFFDQHLLDTDSETESRIRRHIGVCHDVCHSAVMFEDQAFAVEAFNKADIRIGKVQVSSALNVEFSGEENEASLSKARQLSEFSEPKYLHQTSIRVGNEIRFYEDLPHAIAARPSQVTSQWRVHFHVPIYLETIGKLGTTRADIAELVGALKATGNPLPQFEVETYAWTVLPAEHRTESLAQGIAKELAWFHNLMQEA